MRERSKGRMQYKGEIALRPRPEANIPPGCTDFTGMAPGTRATVSVRV
jgi:hypothetical protein